MDSLGMTDPFAQLDEPRTFIKPTPGGRPGAPRTGAEVARDGFGTAGREGFADPDPGPAQAAPASHTDTDTDTDTDSTAGLNPLVALADRLLLLATQLRLTRHVSDPDALRRSLAQGVRDFVARASAAGIAPERVMAARYVLCTMLDEAAADTPWGGSGVWAQSSLLAMFHNETWGGEKVFQLMARLAEKPAANRDLLELIYAALALGFEGRYRVVDNGRAQVEAVRDKLAQILRQQRGDHAPALAQHWQGRAMPRRRALSWLPLAATAALAAVVLVALQATLSGLLSDDSDPVFARIQGLRLPPPVASVAAPAQKPRLAQFLQADIKAGLVAVRDEVDRSVVTVRGDGLFAPASSTLVPGRDALIARIGDALALAGGPVLVTGHTDNTPMRSARFPSNWHLSEERARSVRAMLLERRLPPERVQAEGRAESEPVVPNDSASNRALNRRVEITSMVGRGAGGAGGMGDGRGAGGMGDGSGASGVGGGSGASGAPGAASAGGS